jgi:hypothetical protein
MTLLEQINNLDPALVAGRDDVAIAAALSVGRTLINKVPIADIQAHLQTTGEWWAIKAVSANLAHPAYAAASALMDVANARYENIDTTLSIVGQMLGGLVMTSVMSQASLDTIVNMGVINNPVSPRDVVLAMTNDDGSYK